MGKRKKKQIIDYLKIPALVVACSVALGTAYRYGYDWLTLSERMAHAEEEQDQIKDWIKEQRIIQREQQKINDYYYQKEQAPIISRDGRFFWDEDRNQWRPIQELEQR